MLASAIVTGILPSGRLSWKYEMEKRRFLDNLPVHAHDVVLLPAKSTRVYRVKLANPRNNLGQLSKVESVRLWCPNRSKLRSTTIIIGDLCSD